MSEEAKRMFEETVENLKQMDMQSLLIMRSNSEILKARDALDRKEDEAKAG